MRILVTGATGYIGEAVATRLSAEGHDVLGLTRSTTSSRSRSLADVGVVPVEGDIGVPNSYRQHLDGLDIVVHAVVDADRPIGLTRTCFGNLSDVPARATCRT